MKYSQANFSNLISFCRFSWRTWSSGRREWKSKLQQVDRIISRTGVRLEPSDKHRLRLYSFINQVLMSWVTSLTGASWSRSEQQATRALTALIPFYDDQFDRAERDFTWQSLLEQENEVDPNSIIICKMFLDEIVDHIFDQDQFFKILDRTHLAQQASLDQIRKQLNILDLERITMEKGGYSMLLYRSLWKHSLRPGEREAWYYLGGVLQLSNDIFDIYRDLQQGITTLAIKCRNVPVLRQYFQGRIQLMARAFLDLNYPLNNRRALLRKIMFVCGRVLVCLDQLEEVQRQNGGRFEVENLDRTDLVCDMEKPANFLKGIAYSLIDLDHYLALNKESPAVKTSVLNILS